MKRIKISSDCLACGACTLITKYIIENSDGTVALKESGIIEDSDIEEFQEVINICPVKAISLESYSIVQKQGIEGLNELKSRIINEFNGYKIPMPKFDTYKFNEHDYFIRTPVSKKECIENYNTREKAKEEGLQEFNRIMYSQRKTYIQQILIEYKFKVLKQFTEYVQEQGRYYFDINKTITNKLQEFVNEAQALVNRQIDLPHGFTTCDFRPSFGTNGDEFDRERYIYKIKHLEEIYIADYIIDEIRPLNKYLPWINVEGFKSFDDKYIYYYDLREVTRELAKDIIYYTDYILNTSTSSIDNIIEESLRAVLEEMEKGINGKIKTLLLALENAVGV